MGTVVHFATAWRERPSILPNPALLPAASTAYSKPVMRRYVVSHKIIVNGLLTGVNQRFTHRASNNGAMDMTSEQIKRTREALTETSILLDRELAYLPQHQKLEMIAFYKNHIIKLNTMIAAA